MKQYFIEKSNCFPEQFKSQKAFEDFLHVLCSEDVWTVKNMRDISLENLPADAGRNITFKHASAELSEKLNKIGTLMLKCGEKGHESFYSVHPLALFTLKERVGISCRYSKALLDKGLFENFSEIFNIARPFYNDCGAKLLIRGGQVLACHSNKYSVIPQNEIFTAAANVLATRFPNMTFDKAEYSVGLTSCRYSLENYKSKIMASYRQAWESSGKNIELLTLTKPFVEITTSDLGDSCVTFTPELCIARMSYPLGAPMKVKHHGGKGIGNVERLADMCYSLVSSGLKDVAKLIETKITYPVETMIAVANEIGIFKNAKRALHTIVEEYKQSLLGFEPQTAFDIYQQLVNIKYSLCFLALNQDTQLKVSEAFARALRLDWNQFDEPGPTSVM